MLKHVGPYRSTSSLGRTPSSVPPRSGSISASNSPHTPSNRPHTTSNTPSSIPNTPSSTPNTPSSTPNTPNSTAASSPNSIPKILHESPYESNGSSCDSPRDDDDSCRSSPEFSRRDLSSPESYISSPDSCISSPGSCCSDNSPETTKRMLGFIDNIMESPNSYKDVSSDFSSASEMSSSPETPKKGLPRPSTLPRRGIKGQVLRKSFRSPDSCSLHSTLSYTSLNSAKLSSRSSSSTSLPEHTTTPVKVYLRRLRPDIEYKTVSMSSATTCRQLVLMLLAKFRLRHCDPNLFFVTMEVVVRGPGTGAPIKRLLVLDDLACPAELQQCRPHGEARFSIGVRRGGLLRVHDSILMPGSQYKSLLVSYRTTSDELVKLLLNCYNNKECAKHYAIHEVCKEPYSDRQLMQDEHPLMVQSEWPRASRVNYALVLRQNINFALSLKTRMSWRRSLDQSSTDTESEHEENHHNQQQQQDQQSTCPSSISKALGLETPDIAESPEAQINTPQRSPRDSGFSSSSSRCSSGSFSPCGSELTCGSVSPCGSDLSTSVTIPSTPPSSSSPSPTASPSPSTPFPTDEVLEAHSSLKTSLTLNLLGTRTFPVNLTPPPTPTSSPLPSPIPSPPSTPRITQSCPSTPSQPIHRTSISCPTSLPPITALSCPPSPANPTRSGSPTHIQVQSPTPIQRTIISIPASGPSEITSNHSDIVPTSSEIEIELECSKTITEPSEAELELADALEHLKTLTIKCPNEESLFYI